MTTQRIAEPHQLRRLPMTIARFGVSFVVIAIIVGAFLLPYLWMVSSAFKNQTAIFDDLNPLSWKVFLPVGGTIDNFVALFEKGIGLALVNSLIVAFIQVGGTLVVCTLAAYALTRISFKGRGVVFAVILATFMLPAEALVVPMYGVIAGLNLQDTLLAVALPWVSSVFGLFLLKQAFEEIPMELDEAARLDGAGHFRVFWSIILPNVRTSLATLCLVTFLFSWNAFLWPLTVVQSSQNQVIQVAIAQSVSAGELPNWGLTFAGAAVATVPLILLFLFAQRFFVQGLASSGLK
ncbi:carbohydrate ABC transporter permease [Salinibacterium sp. NSLL150]|uniref:carbohydrate ABC transporter permease n=1 Tax=unclassified Salinibacterium TaxID=2632331 RepID=UPI0018CD76BE|nr:MULTISPECIES: carbohydrate ABC transporter permease [unclassified Salinibacterium]MBH0023843.1 carbohydrate ABC transporter permease [Salinibacterium sp. SWN248]MBH0083174.1 carbohydrate ABC transporter permease [Salinibacterium sp. SWN167]MBH0098816.1 carbohydrate ABC transporter permease [Salinibacterium sp. NSLL35]MBH0101571.1 carbohydrate ABC transporter permease [Salinibacterium sp. NSLL150]MBH0104330.1 carbohydrate ABC transporter permease [Salinibacterium sp. NSLL16]